MSHAPRHHPPDAVALPGSGWQVWRSAVLRAPGFPAAGLDRLVPAEARASAEAADTHLAGGSDRAPFDAAFAAATTVLATELGAIAGDARVREAVAWQSPSAVEALRGLATPRGSGRGWRQREREVLVTRYWQRYCGKNDTIGFFGPVCWTEFTASGPAVTVKAGPELVRRRVVELEWRVLDGFAARLAADVRFRPHLPVTRAPQLAMDGDRLLRVGAPASRLSPAAVAVLAAADGSRSAAELVRSVLTDPRSGLRKEADGLLLLEQLAADGIVHWGIDLPVTVGAEAHLRMALGALDAPGLRAEALADLDRLIEARDALAASAGDPDAVPAAMRRLSDQAAALTVAAAQHRPGATYAGRGVAYEDTVRDIDISFGPAVLSALAPALTPLLQAARWLTVAIADAYRGVLRELYDEEATGGATVSAGALWYLANGVMFGDGPASRVHAEFVARWSRLLGLDRVAPATRQVTVDSAELARSLPAAFPATAPGWSAGRLHSPDLHLCARSEEALARGEFTAVLGELHVAWLTVDAEVLVRFHPDRAALREQLHRDLGDRVLLLYPPDFPRFTARIADALVGPADTLLGYTDAPVPEPARVLPLAALTVSLVEDELLAHAPDGRAWPLLELFSPFLSALTVDAFKLTGAAAHTPRVTVDRLVVHRETWRTTIGDSGLVGGDTEAGRYLAARRFRGRLGLPERVFVRVATELKPCFVDFRSPAYVAALLAMVRAAHRAGGDDVALVCSEMLPDVGDAWLPDADGQRYFSELRIVARDPLPARTAQPGGRP